MARKIEVEIVGDSRSLERAFQRSARSATVFESRMRGASHRFRDYFKIAAGAAGVTFGFEGIVRGIEKSVNAAEDLNKEMSKTRIVFGRSARTVEAWAKTTAEALGIDEAAALKAASNFGILFDRLGKGRDVSAEMSKRLVQVAADLASFFHVSSSTVLTGLLRGIYGQARGLKVLGINMTNARVTAEAYRDGIAHVGTKLTEAQKVQARFNIILRDAAPAAGNFAAHAKDWANVQARLSAEIEDMAAALGQALLPYLTQVADKFSAWLADPENKKQVLDGMATGISALGTAAQGAAYGFQQLKDAADWMDKHHLHWLKYGLTTPFPTQVQAGLNYLRTGSTGGGGMTPAQRWAKLSKMPPQHSIVPAEWYIQHGLPLPPQYGGPKPGGGGGGGDNKGLTGAARAAQRNLFFDNRLARQLNRLQDLGLRQQLERLRQLAAEVRGRIAITHDATRRLTLEDKLLDILRQQKQVQADITDQIKQANAALKDRADAIKSAILDRLQARQTRIENQRALQDAREQLRIALQLGGPKGIRAARRAVADARMAQLIARAQGAHPSLTAGGRFALGNIVTINIHGVTDPEAVARRVTQILNRRARHTTSQTRGPGAGQTAGTH